jgi:CheY-like chemotaxis protein
MTALILVVDDSPIQRKLFAATLNANGYDTVMAENGRQGIELALHHLPALILMDVAMPEMDGPSAVRELRRYPSVAQIPIVAVTALADPADQEELFRAGYTDIVDKNGDRTALLTTIRQLLRDQ